MKPLDVISHPLATEKAIRLMESENKLIFVVHAKATKPEIKTALEEAFPAKVERVNVHVTMHGQKRAIVRFKLETPAIDIATDLGVL